VVKERGNTPFDPKTLLSIVRDGTFKEYRKKQIVFAQGAAADALFYINKGRVKLSVVSKQGKEAVIAILGVSGFFGEGCLAGQPLRIAITSVVTDCATVRSEKGRGTHSGSGYRIFQDLEGLGALGFSLRSSRRALGSFRSAVSKPSVNQLKRSSSRPNLRAWE
jgi:hypothetical protein